jgi:hypothetical protein
LLYGAIFICNMKEHCIVVMVCFVSDLMATTTSEFPRSVSSSPSLLFFVSSVRFLSVISLLLYDFHYLASPAYFLQLL